MFNTILGVEDRAVKEADKKKKKKRNPFMELILCFREQSGERKRVNEHIL